MWKRSRQTCSRMSMASFLARSLGVECVNNNKFQSACTSCLINIISKWRLKPLHMDTSSVHYYPPHPLYWKKKIGLDVNQHSRTSAILVQKGEENKWAESRGHCYSRIIFFSFFFWWPKGFPRPVCIVDQSSCSCARCFSIRERDHRSHVWNLGSFSTLRYVKDNYIALHLWAMQITSLFIRFYQWKRN